MNFLKVAAIAFVAIALAASVDSKRVVLSRWRPLAPESPLARPTNLIQTAAKFDYPAGEAANTVFREQLIALDSKLALINGFLKAASPVTNTTVKAAKDAGITQLTGDDAALQRVRKQLGAAMAAPGWKAQAKSWGAELNENGALLRKAAEGKTLCSDVANADKDNCVCYNAQEVRLAYLAQVVVVVTRKLIDDGIIAASDAATLNGVSMGTDTCKSDVDMTISGPKAIVLQKALYSFFLDSYEATPDAMLDTNFYVAEFSHTSKSYSTAPPCTEPATKGDQTIYLAGLHSGPLADTRAMWTDQHKTAFRSLKYFYTLAPHHNGQNDTFMDAAYGNLYTPADNVGSCDPGKSFCSNVTALINNAAEFLTGADTIITAKVRSDAVKLFQSEYVKGFKKVDWKSYAFVISRMSSNCADYESNCQELNEQQKLEVYSKTAESLYEVIGKGARATKTDCTKFMKTTGPVAILAPESYWSRNTFAHSVTCRQGNFEFDLYAPELFDSVVENWGHLIHATKDKLNVDFEAVGLSKYSWRMFDAGANLWNTYIQPYVAGKPYETQLKVGLFDSWVKASSSLLALYKARNQDKAAREAAGKATMAALGLINDVKQANMYVSALLGNIQRRMVRFTAIIYVLRVLTNDFTTDKFDKPVKCSSLSSIA